jgi:hypothetical protein
MLGIGTTELIIFLVIALLSVVPGIIGVGVVIWLIVRHSRKKPTDE